MSGAETPRSPIGVEDHWITLVVATAIVAVVGVLFSVELHWLLVLGMAVSAILELGLKGIPKEDEESKYWFVRQLFDSDHARHESDRRQPASSRDSEASPRDELETLRDRYARGELTEEQFERKLDHLLETDTLENTSEWREKARTERNEK